MIVNLPNVADLQSHLDRLEANPGSVILLAIEMAEPRCNFTRCTCAWLSKAERKALRLALERARKTRARLLEDRSDLTLHRKAVPLQAKPSTEYSNDE